MCIRDSRFTQGAADILEQAKTMRSSEASPFYKKAFSETPCLLYTSDAADERSSVDLGGRRIIKKKKHQYDSEVCLYYTKTEATHRIDEIAKTKRCKQKDI